jgi:hypothetical protein
MSNSSPNARPAGHADHQRRGTTPSSSFTDPEVTSSAEGTGETTKLESPFKPLMWLLVPFILVLLYGFLS